MSSTPSTPLQFHSLRANATAPSSARTSELGTDGTYMSVDAHKRFDNVRIFRSVGTGPCELSTTLNLTRAEARALAVELLAAVDAAEPPKFELSLDEIGYALSRSVPDMARGFTIQTNYADLPIPSGELAAGIQAVLGNALTARWDVPAVAKAA